MPAAKPLPPETGYVGDVPGFFFVQPQIVESIDPRHRSVIIDGGTSVMNPDIQNTNIPVMVGTFSFRADTRPGVSRNDEGVDPIAPSKVGTGNPIILRPVQVVPSSDNDSISSVVDQENMYFRKTQKISDDAQSSMSGSSSGPTAGDVEKTGKTTRLSSKAPPGIIGSVNSFAYIADSHGYEGEIEMAMFFI